MVLISQPSSTYFVATLMIGAVFVDLVLYGFRKPIHRGLYAGLKGSVN